MMNNFFSMMNPQMQQSFQTLQQQAMQSGNPQEFIMQKYGNDALFQQGFKIFNEQGVEGLNKFIASKFK